MRQDRMDIGGMRVGPDEEMRRVNPQLAQEGECSEKARLRHEFQIAVADYSHAVVVLSERSGVMSKVDYTRIRDFIETTRARAEAARVKLDQHVAEHGCGTSTP